MTNFEIRQMKHAMRESRRFFKKVDKSMGRVVLPHNIVSFSIREGANIPSKGIDSYMFPSKNK